MAIIRPFRALRPLPTAVAQVSAVPYDVVSTEEAHRLAVGNPLSFLHISRAEIGLPAGTDPHSDAVYNRALENFNQLRNSAPLIIEAVPSVYFYRLRMGSHQQTGLAACYSVDEYERDLIKKHERTRRDKEDDRTRHITLQQAFRNLPCLYIADGHHRAASAARTRKYLAEKEPGVAHVEADWMYAVAFPDNQTQILPYNRVVKDLAGHTSEALLAELKSRFHLTPGTASPASKGEVSLYLGEHWYTLHLKGQAGTDDIGSTLDVSLLQEQVLAPIFKVGDPRTDKRIDFVGGIRGTGELERLVGEGKAAAAFSLYPVSVDDLMRIADADEIMPPKSTWFEPKLRDGLLSHLL
jgi:uncharacterized protein (DUF1015 family)